MPRPLSHTLPVRWLARTLPLLLMACPCAAQNFDFSNMVLLGRHDLYDGYNDVWGFVGTDGREYIIQGTTTGTAWWDVQDPKNAVLVDFIPGPGSIWRDMFVIGDHAYVGTEGGGGIQIIDISDPTSPMLVNTYDATVSSSHNVFGDASRNLVYVVGSSTGNGGVQILDASDPVNLVEIGSWQGQYVHDISLEGTLAYVSLIYVGRFRLLDVSDSTNPVNYGKIFFDSSDHASWPLGDGIHVALASETTGGHLKIVDVSNPDSITISDEDDPAPMASIHNIHVQGTRAYASWYARGTRVYDVSVPTAIAEIGYFDTYPPTDGGGVGPGNWGVYPHLPSGTIAANDGTHGLFLLRYDPDVATLDGTVSSSGGGLVAEATVSFAETHQEVVTDSTGAYKFSAEPGPHDLEAAAFAFETSVVHVVAGAGGTVTTNIVLTKLPAGGVSGTITDAISGLPIQGVELALVGTPLSTVTDATGQYAFPDVPTSPSPTYDLEVRRAGYIVPSEDVTLTTGMTITKDLQLYPAAAYVDFSDPAGWSVESDSTTTDGFWEFGEPVGTFLSGEPYQPELDHSVDPEDQCAVTGKQGGGVGQDDVDGGATRLLSPVYDLSAMAEPHVLYYRTYAVNASVEAWQTHLTTDGGASWTLIDSTVDHEPAWQAIDVDLAGVALGASAVQFRFTCEDPDPGQVVDGALDDFTLYDAAAGPGSVGVPVGGKAARFELWQNFPNPFPVATRIRFSLPTEQHVTLSVFDVSGRRVTTLVDARLPAGVHEAPWDGTTRGGAVAAGVYFYKLRTKDSIRTRKMIRLQ